MYQRFHNLQLSRCLNLEILLCLWLWLGGSHHSLPVITDQFQLQWKSSLPLSSENSGNSVLIAGTEILNGRHEWISCFHFTQSPPFHTHTQCKFGYYSGENTFISTTISGYTIFPDAQHRKLDDTFKSVSENLSNITKEGEHIYII